jgi:hypothetical protein
VQIKFEMSFNGNNGYEGAAEPIQKGPFCLA